MRIAYSDCESVSALRATPHNLLADGVGCVGYRDSGAMESEILAMLSH